MATTISMIRKLCVNAGIGSVRLFRRRTINQKGPFYAAVTNSSFRPRWYFQPRTLTIAGTTVGISYALFGIKFGKKDDEETDPLTELYRSARLAHMRNDLQKADDLYHEVLKLGAEMLKEEKITEEKYLTTRTLMYDGLAEIALVTGQVEKAEHLYKETMKGCLQQGMDQYDNAIVEMSMKLASIYAMMGKKSEAEEGYKFCISAQNSKVEAREKLWRAEELKKGGKVQEVQNVVVATNEELDENEKNSASLLGMALSSYGRFLLYERRYTEALPMFQRALMLAQHTLGFNSNQYIVLLNDIATLYIVTKNLDTAEKVLKEGIALSEKHKLGEGAMLYCNLGAVYLRKGEPTVAVNECQKGLEWSQQYDHKMAYRMAEACITKGVSVMTDKNKS